MTGRERPRGGLTSSLSVIGLLVGTLVGLITESLGLAAAVSFWGDTGPLVILSAVIGAVLWKTPLRFALEAAAAALSILWMLVSFTPLTAWLAKDLPRRDSLAPADAVFVAASSIQLDGELTSAAMSRLIHGLELLSEGTAPAIVLSDLPLPHPSYAGAAKSLRDHFGIDRETITVSSTENTHSEALALARLCRERGWKRVIVVTSPYHSRRACSAVEREGVEVICSPSVETEFDVENLERSKERRVAFSHAIHERIGLWVYRRRGWIHETAGTD